MMSASTREIDPTLQYKGKLTDALILAAPLPQSGYSALTDGQRLFLRVTPDGGRFWRLKFVAGGGKESQASLGKYPAVSIEQARTLAAAIREQASKGRNPIREKRQALDAAADVRALTFGKLAMEWLAFETSWTDRTREKHVGEVDKLKALHHLPITEIKPSQVLTILEAIAKARKYETAKRVGQTASNIFGFATRYDIVHNPARDRKTWVKPAKVEHHAAITDPAEFAVLLELIDAGGWGMSPTVSNAFRFLPRVFVRQGELCSMEWSEVNFRTATWLAQPKAKSKLKAPHVVPLARQALAVLEAQKALGLPGRYVWPHSRKEDRHMSTESIAAALGLMGYTSDQMTAHGFRTSAATMLREHVPADKAHPERRFDSELVERQLSHKVGNAVAGAYDRSQRIEERRAMMQAWADYLDTLKAAT